MSIDFRHTSAIKNISGKGQNCKYHPFKEDSQVLSFSELIEVKAVMQQVLSNLENKDSMQVVFGEKGIGKTMLMRNISLSRRLNCTVIKGANGITVANLFKQLSAQISAPLGSLTCAPMKHINLFVENFKSQEKPLCVIIDDAEKIPLQTLAALIHCNNRIIQENREDFTIALFGATELKNKIAPLISEDDKLETKFHELKTLSEESIVHYIYTKLRHAGWKGALPIISTNDLSNIKKRSGGIPKNINHVISHHYYDEWNKNWQQGSNRSSNAPSEMQQPILKIAATLTITSILAWVMITPSLAMYRGGWDKLVSNYVATSNSIVEKISGTLG